MLSSVGLGKDMKSGTAVVDIGIPSRMGSVSAEPESKPPLQNVPKLGGMASARKSLFSVEGGSRSTADPG